MARTIRDAREHEIEQISALLLTSYEQYMPAPTEDADLVEAFAEYRLDIADVKSRWDSTVQIVAEDAGVVVGAVTYFEPGAPGRRSWRWRARCINGWVSFVSRSATSTRRPTSASRPTDSLLGRFGLGSRHPDRSLR